MEILKKIGAIILGILLLKLIGPIGIIILGLILYYKASRKKRKLVI